jgi:hypothetical protein
MQNLVPTICVKLTIHVKCSESAIIKINEAMFKQLSRLSSVKTIEPRIKMDDGSIMLEIVPSYSLFSDFKYMLSWLAASGE